MGFWHPVVEFLGAIVGVDPDDWPGGDEDALREYARQYDAIAKELRTTVATGCREGSTAVAAAWNGEAGRALSAQILAYGTDKDFGGVETIAGAAEELAQYLRDQADTIVRAKVMIIAQIAVGVLMFAIPAGKALSVGMRAAFRQALKDFIHNRARGVMKQALSALAARAGKALAMTPVKFFRGAAIAGVGAGVYGLAPNTIAQGYGVLTGQSGRTTPDGHHADGWNWDETKQYAAIAAVATPIAIATGVGMGKLGGVVTGKVSALNGRVPRFVGRRIAGATTMAVAMPAADWVVTRHPLTFESVWKSAVMGAAVPGGGSHGPAAAAPHGDPIRVEPVRDHPMVGGDRPPPDPPQLAAEPGAQTAHSTADAPVADAGTGVGQTTGGNVHAGNAAVESRTETGAVGGVHTTQPASGVGTAEASTRSGARTDTTTTKTTAAEHHTRTTAPEKTVAPEKAAPSDKPPSGPDKSVVPEKPAETGKSDAVEKKENVPQVANRRAETPAGEGAQHADQPAAAQPHPGERPRQEHAATPEVRDWTGRQEHRDEVHRREADAAKARDEHQTAVENRKNAPSTEHAERAADQSGRELRDAEKALDKHVRKHGDTDPRAHELREQRDHARAKDDTAQHDLMVAKDADAQVQNAKLAADARRVSYLAAKLDYTLSRLSPAEIRQLAEGKLNLVSEVRLTPEEARMLAIHELVHRTPDGWGFAMNWTQIHADLALRSDLLVQMMTGEGKTAVAVLALGMTAAEHPVHFMTANRSLAAQAHEKFRKVLEPLGYDVVQVDPAVRYGKPRRPTVYVGDVAAFGWSMGRGHRVPGKHVVVDEVDAVAVELATQVYTHSSGAAGEASAKTQAEVMLAKWALDSGKFDKSDFGLTVDGAAPKLTEAGRQRLAELIGVEPTSRRFATHVTRLEHAAQARWVLKPGRDYIRAVIEGNETILIVSKHSGEPLVDRETLLEQRWTGVAQALEARHGLDLRADAKHTNAVRTKDLLETYDHLSGMSGTAKDAGQAVRDLYGADKIGRVVEIESFNTRKLEFRPPQHFATAEAKYRAIVDQAIADMSKDGDPSAGRPQAIVVEHNDEVALVTRLVEQRLAEHELAGGIEIQQVNAEAMARFIAEHTFDARMDAIWKQAGKPGTITIGNKVLGRGIDIEIHPDAFDLGHRPSAADHVFTVKGDGREAVGGGLAVRVGFHDVESPRGTVQALNRAGRQGAPGEASLYASHQDELFRRHSSALEAAVAYHDAPSTTAHNEALRNYTEAAVAHARGETNAATLKAAHEALKKAEQSLAVSNYSAAVESSQLNAQHTNLADIRIQHTAVPERTPAPDNSSGTTPGPDDTARSRRGREQSDALVPDMLRTTPSYQGLSATDQLRVVDAIKQVTGNDPALIEGLRPLLESPGLRALEPAELLAEASGWHHYNDLFGRAVELDARITGSPDMVDVEHWSSHTWTDATDLGEVRPGERLSTSGRRGQIVNLDQHAGVYSIARDGAEWIVKLFPDKADAQQRKNIADEFAGVVAAAGTGYGPTPYGLVTATIAGKPYVGLAMGRVQGAMVHDPQPSEPAAIAEVGRARRAVTFDTVLQLHQYLRRLLDSGHHSHGELQPLIDPATGNLRVIDLADVLPLLDDPDYQRLARADHGLGMESIDIRDQLVRAAVENAHQDADRARLLAAPTDGMSAGAVRQAVDAVRRQMRLPDGIELDVVVEADGATLAREHGIPPSAGPRPGFFRMEDGRGVVYLSAADHSSPADVSASVWHEIVGHYGWRLFSPEERAQILAAVHQLRRLDAELSAEIDELYADLPGDLRDEEFLARLAEGGVPSRLTQAWNGVLSTVFGTALHRIGAISNETLQRARHDHELAPLYKILRTLLRAIRTNRPVHDDGSARDRRVWVGRTGDRGEFRGDGRRMPDRVAVRGAARGVAPQVAAAVAAARGEARDVVIEEERITVTLAGGQRLTMKFDVSGIFSGGPVRWERTAGAADWARIQLSPRAGDKVVGRAVAHAVAGVLSAYRGESEVDQVRAGRRAEVGYLVDRLERGESPYRSRRELGHVLRQLNKIEGRRFGVPPLPRGLRQRVRTVLPRNTIRAWLAEEIDRREDQLTEPPSSRPTRLPSPGRRPARAGQSLGPTHAPDPAAEHGQNRATLAELKIRLADLDTERQRLLQRYDARVPTELHQLTDVLVRISATFTQYADAMQRAGLDPHTTSDGPEGRPVSASVLHNDPIHTRNLTDLTWAPGRHHEPSVDAENAALIAAKIHQATNGRYGPFTLAQIQSHATTGRGLLDIAADIVFAEEHRRTPSRALAARVDFHRSLAADHARAVPASLLQPERPPLDWPTYAKLRPNALRQHQTDLINRANFRTESAATALDDPTKAGRHTAIAAACRAAAQQADQARQAWQAYLDTPTPAMLQAAKRQDALYEQRRAESLPPKDVLQTATVSGQLPHLTALTNELNEALAQQNKTFRITPELLHRTLRAETRRLLSPDGLVLTVGNDPRADVTELTQFELTLNPSELQEVLDNPVLIEEAQLGQLVQGGYNVATTITQTVSASSGLRLAPLLSALPDTNPLKVAALISPSIEYTKNVALSVTGGATEYGLPGAVEVIQGEIHRFRSSHPTWSWRMRTSAAGSWSARHVVAGGTTKDTTTLELGISHAYAVGAAAETVRIPSDERRTDLPEHVATRVDGLNELADRAIAGLRQRLGGLDRIGHDQLRGLITEDAPGRLAETTRPGGLTRVITSGGRAVAYARLETVAVWKQATLLGDSSKDHKVERLRVGFSGTSGGETFAAGDSVAVSAGYGGTATQDLGTSSWDLGPSGRVGVNAGHDSSVNTGDTAIHPSVQRMQPTIGVKLRLEHRLTIHRVDQAGEFTLTSAGDAVLRMPENDAYRYGLPVPSAAIVRDEDGQPRYGVDGRRLLRGDPQPTDEAIQLPVWMQRDFQDRSSQHPEGPRLIRGAGPALVQELSGADEALQQFLEHLSAKGLIPYGELGGKDPALAAGQLANLERIGQQLSRHRLETGYDPAAQEGIVLRLDRHRTGLPPEQHTYRIRLRSYTGEARLLGLSTGETVVNLDIGSNTTGRSGGWSRSLPWQAKFGFSDKPASGAEGSTPEIAPSYGRSSLGRFISWATGSTVNRVSLTESTAPVAVFEVPHSIVITEVGHETKPIVTVDGTARLSIDSEFCRRDDDTEPTPAIKGKVDPALLRTATFQAVDVGDLVGQLTDELPELARGDSSALHHLSAFLNPRNLAARPELLTAPYRTSLLVTPAPSNVEQTVNRRGVTTGRARLTVDTTLLNLRYVGSGRPVNGEINLTLGSSTLTTGTSTSGTFGLGGGDGAVATDGSSYGGSLSGSRSKDRSASSTETQIGGVERLAIRDGEHYQFWADLGVVAELRAIGAEPRAAVVRSGAVMLTLPERDALRLYGLGKLDLPATKVDEAVNRLLNGELHVPSRTVLAIARRQTDPVQRERLAATLRETVAVLRMNWWLERIRLHRTGQAGLLDAVMPTAEELIERGTTVRLPGYYDTTMGAGLIDETSLQDPDGHETDLYREVLAAAESSAPEALDDPVFAAGLRGDLAGLRWHGHIDDLLSQSGFVTEYPTGDGRRVTVRIKLEYDGPIRIDGVPDAGGQENAFNIIQAYDYREESRSVTSATTYGGQVGGSLGKVGSGTAGVGTDLGTSTTASSTEQNTRMSRALWNPTKRVSRGYRMTVQVDGAEPRNLTGEMTLLVPASAVNAPMPQAAETGNVVLPRGTVVEGTIARKLFKTVYSRLGKPDLLTEEGARLHRTALENMLSAATRLAAFERIASPEGHTMVQLPVPGRRSRLVAVQVRAKLSNLQLVAEGDAQLGQIDRQQRITQLTTKSNRLLPTSRSVGGSNPTGIQGGLSSGEQVGERSSDSTGNRNETTMNERGPVVTVKVDVDYYLRYEDRRLDRRGGFQVASKDTGYASGTAYLTMFRREYDALRGKTSTPPPAAAVAEGNLHTAGSIPPPNPSGAA
ncbi:DEAD/DEAH box helicase [Kribbella sindirgiensis]|uniref:SecA family profile domain-containing protein n=1 Tax=Kribbella sindirgiensis TaxID=1124744 RepID=A0A4V2M1S1_9ACTN|nr:DEAD/DEAH box helicase [Kribbella sindirgiensis]TCC18624.1 hypothetical protein E0H50_38540 [Kribbella sindirgiensis]